MPNHHHFTLEYAELFGLALDPFEPSAVDDSPFGVSRPAFFFAADTKWRKVRPPE